MTYLLRELPISAKEYAFGRSKIFIRSVSVLDQVSCDWSEPAQCSPLIGPAGGVAAGPRGGARHHHPEDLPRLAGAAELEQGEL